MARRRGQFQKKIDFTHWTGGFSSANAQGAGTLGAVMVAAQHDPETLLRTRGNLLGYVDGAQAPGGLVRITVGLIIVPEGTGTTVLWAPLTDADAPWLYWTSFRLGYEEGVTDVVDFPGITSYREVVDSKAMRIVRNSEVQFVVENTTVLGALSVNVGMDLRFLTGR